ncbi:MAG: hypothetical protein ACRYGR_05470 [Janthinobacterium lividum]
MNYRKKCFSLSFLVGSLLISTLNATHMIDDTDIIRGKFIYIKDPILQKDNFGKYDLPHIEAKSKKVLSPLYIKDEQNEEYQIFSNNFDNRILKLALLNHYKVSFIEDLHGKKLGIKKSSSQNLTKLYFDEDTLMSAFNNVDLISKPATSTIDFIEHYDPLISEKYKDGNIYQYKLDEKGKLEESKKQDIRIQKSKEQWIKTYGASTLEGNKSKKIDNFKFAIQSKPISELVLIEEKPKYMIGKAAAWFLGDNCVVNIGKKLNIDYKN